MRRMLVATVIALILAVLPTAGAAQAEPDCLDPAAIADRDFVRHSEALADPALCLSEVQFTENGIDWHLIVIRDRDRPGPLWAVPHDEEDAAFDGAMFAVREFGGTVVAIENGEDRLVAGLDPNHIFAGDIDDALACGLASTSPVYVEMFLDWFDPRFPVIGLHANWDGYLEGGGLGSISINRVDEKMRPFPSATAEGRFADEDTVAMLVGRALPAESDAVMGAIEWLNQRGVHVIYRHVTPENNGCTLADYLTLNAVGFYINLEVEHGDGETMPELIRRAYQFINSSGHARMF